MAEKIKIHLVSNLDAKGFEATDRAVRRTGRVLKSEMVPAVKDVGFHWADLKAKFEVVSGAIKATVGGLWRAIKGAFQFETLETQFSVLMGSVDLARERIAELADLAARTPFTLSDLTTASKQLHVFSSGTLGGVSSLTLIGDAAAATGASIQELSFWVGRAYSMISGGQAWGEAAMRLQELGILTPEVRTEMEDLQKAGASNYEVWSRLEKRLGTFSGGMQKLSETGDGLVSTLSDNWSAAVRKFGQAFMKAAKDGLQKLIDLLNKLAEDGTIERWAKSATAALDSVVRGLVRITNLVVDVGTHLSEGRKAWSKRGQSREDWLSDAAGMLNGPTNIARQMEADEAKKETARREREERAKREALAKSEEKKKRDAMAAAQAVADAKKAAKAKAKADEKAAADAKKAAEEKARADKKAREDAEKARKAEAERLVKSHEYLDTLTELDIQQALMASASRVLARETMKAAAREGMIKEAKELGAAGFVRKFEEVRQGRLDRQKEDDRMVRRMGQLEAKEKRGVRLSRRDAQRLEDFKRWRALGNRGGNQWDPADAARRQLEAVRKQTDALKQIQAGLERALAVR